MNNYTYIDNNEALKQIEDFFGNEKIIGVDLEADSMFHFQEKVCLIQMASNNTTVVIDPLEISDMSPLKAILENGEIRKVFHGSDYDVRSIYRDYQIEINNLFDTEMASRFLGIPESGLGSVLLKRFGLKVDKSFQKKDWSIRPLPEPMIYYAAGDVKYLVKLAEILDNELLAEKRAHWVKEECDILSRVRAPEPDGTPLFVKFKGAGKLDSKSLFVLEALLQKRLALAKKRDKPPFKIIGNRELFEIARIKPRDLKSLKKIKSVSLKHANQLGDILVEAVKTVDDVSPNEFPDYPRARRTRHSAAVPMRVQELKNWRDKKALKYQLPSSMLLNKSQMKSIAIVNPKELDDLDSISELREWQKSEFGKNIINVLNGNY
jgi:ribonuclease D